MLDSVSNALHEARAIPIALDAKGEQREQTSGQADLELTGASVAGCIVEQPIEGALIAALQNRIGGNGCEVVHPTAFTEAIGVTVQDRIAGQAPGAEGRSLHLYAVHPTIS